MSNKDQAIQRLKTYQEEINSAMQAYFESDDACFCLDVALHGVDAFKKLREFSERPGKRVRGALTMLAYEGLGGTNKETALQAAVAVELIQNYLLIVDDVMDRSPTRRGSKTVHEQYIDSLSNEHSTEDAAHLGNMLGINVGLLGQHLASDILSRLDEDPKHVLHASSLFHRNIAATCYGQIEDLFNDAAEAESVKEADISRVHQLKNSYYTYINPLQVGAALAGNDQSTLDVMYTFGIPAGIAFQLRDDIIGLFGTEEATGKSVLDDLKEGKMTLLINYALSNGTEEQLEVIRNALGNESVTTQQHEAVKQIVIDTGALKYTEDKALEYAQASQEVLADQQWPQEMKDFLSGLVDYTIERNK